MSQQHQLYLRHGGFIVVGSLAKPPALRNLIIAGSVVKTPALRILIIAGSVVKTPALRILIIAGSVVKEVSYRPASLVKPPALRNLIIAGSVVKTPAMRIVVNVVSRFAAQTMHSAWHSTAVALCFVCALRVICTNSAMTR